MSLNICNAVKQPLKPKPHEPESAATGQPWVFACSIVIPKGSGRKAALPASDGFITQQDKHLGEGVGNGESRKDLL